jgi:hypothetical protein
MTQVVFYKRGEHFVRIESKGHTGYAESGADIVCAGLSALIQGALLGILKVVGVKADHRMNEDKGTLSIILPDGLSDAERHDCSVILNTLYTSVTDLAEGYSEYIKVEVK